MGHKFRQAPKLVPGAGSGQAARVDIVVAARKVAELSSGVTTNLNAFFEACKTHKSFLEEGLVCDLMSDDVTSRTALN